MYPDRSRPLLFVQRKPQHYWIFQWKNLNQTINAQATLTFIFLHIHQHTPFLCNVAHIWAMSSGKSSVFELLSNHPVHSHGLIWVYTFNSIQRFYKRAVEALIRLQLYRLIWLLFAYAETHILPRHCLYVKEMRPRSLRIHAALLWSLQFAIYATQKFQILCGKS